MRIDVSELKSFKSCKRQWKLSSRNGYKLMSRTPNPNLAMGTLFHESLHALYLGSPLDTVMANVRKEMEADSDGALLAMIPGYAKKVLPDDLDKYVVLDIEHKFEISALDLWAERSGTVDTSLLDINLCGSIDMIVYCPEDNKIYGFEHKTAKKFRPTSFLWMDEQPRLYYLALEKYVEEYNKKQYNKWLDECDKAKHPDSAPPKPVPVQVGGVFLNEVKKLLRQFQYQRTLCTYEENDLDRFLQAFLRKCVQIKRTVESGDYACPEPDYFKCQMCEYSDVCETYMYGDITKEEVLKEFSEMYQEREVDHLDEKVERSSEQ